MRRILREREFCFTTSSLQNFCPPPIEIEGKYPPTFAFNYLEDKGLIILNNGPGEGGGGGDSNIEMPGCVCLLSENRPILNDPFSCKTYLY